MPQAKRLDDETTGLCPACGEHPAYPYAVPGLPDGYADACEVCADNVVEDASHFAAQEGLIHVAAPVCER